LSKILTWPSTSNIRIIKIKWRSKVRKHHSIVTANQKVHVIQQNRNPENRIKTNKMIKRKTTREPYMENDFDTEELNMTLRQIQFLYRVPVIGNIQIEKIKYFRTINTVIL